MSGIAVWRVAGHANGDACLVPRRGGMTYALLDATVRGGVGAVRVVPAGRGVNGQRF